jgi:hypothetical protein
MCFLILSASGKTGNVRLSQYWRARYNHCCPGRAKSVACFECVSVALLIKNATRMHRIILSSVAWLALSYFCTLSRKRHDFRKKLLSIKIFRFSLQLSSETFLILRRIQRYIVVNICALRPWYKGPVILVILSWHFDFLNRYSKKYRKIRIVEAELFHADR